MGVTGANGAGKTTLIRMVVREAEPHSGEVRLDGMGCDEAPVYRDERGMRERVDGVGRREVGWDGTVGCHRKIWGGMRLQEVEIGIRWDARGKGWGLRRRSGAGFDIVEGASWSGVESEAGRRLKNAVCPFSVG